MKINRIYWIFSDVVALDFSRAQESANLINAWCAEATKNHIQNIVTPGETTPNFFIAPVK